MNKKEELTILKLECFLKKNPKAKAKFVSYYKYTFTFECEIGRFDLGEDVDDIYRFSVDPEMPLSELLEYKHMFVE